MMTIPKMTHHGCTGKRGGGSESAEEDQKGRGGGASDFSSLIIVNTYYYHISVKGASVKLNDYHDLISYYCERCFSKVLNYCE